MSKGWKVLTEEVFNKVKKLQEAGLTSSEIVGILDLKKSKIIRINQAQTWKDYLVLREKWQSDRANKLAKPELPAYPPQSESAAEQLFIRLEAIDKHLVELIELHAPITRRNGFLGK